MIYKYCKTDGFDILNNCRLRFSRIDSFNDPFELMIGIDENTAHNNIKKEYEEIPEIIDGWARTLDSEGISYDKSSPKDILNKFTNFQINDFKKAFKTLGDYLKGDMGIVCFSKSPDIIQMWAHYTDNHKGIVVGLDENEFIPDKENLFTVCYDDNIVLIPITGIPDRLDRNADKLIPKIVRRKESNWSYEKEVRVYATFSEIDLDGYYYYKEIPTSAIKEVYLGLRSDDTTKLIAGCLKKKAEYNHIKIYKTHKHETAFKLVPQEI